LKKKAIIFDLDGVLVHTDQYHYEAWKVIADNLNIRFDEVINNRLRGVSRMASLEIILSLGNLSLSDEEKHKLAEEKNEIYKHKLDFMSPESLQGDVRKVLDQLKAKGVFLAIGSSSRNARRILEKVDLTTYFDVIVDGTDILKSKPDPEVFIKAAEKLDLNPIQCIVVEDAKAGIIAADTGGFDTIGMGEAALFNLTKWPIESFNEILKYV